MSTPEERADELRREMPAPRKHQQDPDYMEEDDGVNTPEDAQEPTAAEKIAQAEAFMDELCADADYDTTIDDDWLAERERIAAAATDGPWAWHGESAGAIDANVCLEDDEEMLLAEEMNEQNAEFMADARTAVPALVAEVRRLRHEGDLMRRSLELQALTLNTLLDANARLRVKRCHYCDAPMREKELVRDGAVVGMQYRCSGGCP